MKMDKLNSLLDLHFITKRPLCLVGPAGVGKTSMVKEYAKKKGVNLYEYRAAYSEPGDLKGLCAQDGDNMTFLRPNDFPPVTDENCILFFDEVNRASTAVMNCILQAADGSGRIASHKLPEGCLVIAAINPDNQNHMVNAMDFALVNRFNMVNVDFDNNVLLAYGRKNNWHPKVLGFINIESNLFSDDYDGQSNMATPRSLHYLSDMEHAGLGKDSELHRITAQGLLGSKLGIEYHAYATGEQPVTVEELLNDKDALKRVKKLSDPEALRADLLGVTNNMIVEWYRSLETSVPDKKNQKKMVDYLTAIPADLAAGVIAQVLNLRSDLVDMFQAETALRERLGQRLSA